MAFFSDLKQGASENRFSYLLMPLFIFLGFAISFWLLFQSSEVSNFPEAATSVFTFSSWVNEGEDYLKEHYRWVTRLIASYVNGGYSALENFLVDSSWLFVVSLLIIPSLAAGGLRLALFVLFGIFFWGLVGMWESAMETLALMGLSVFLSVIVGVFLGVLCALSDRIESSMKPVLDTMQVMPAFVYLIPAMFFFGIGGAPAILATMIYAMPPMIRLTNLGIRQVPNETIEAATAFGSSKTQILFKVQAPLALPSIMMGINQTIMMALALVVLATFIGAQGLGSEIWMAIRKLDVGHAAEGGLCVLFMAIMFDRFGKAVSAEPVTLPADSHKFYFLPQTWEIYSSARLFEKPLGYIYSIIRFIFSSIVGIFAYLIEKFISLANLDLAKATSQFINLHYFFITSVLILIGINIFDVYGAGIGTFPETWTISIREPIEKTVYWLTVNPTFISITKGLKAMVYLYLLHPLDIYLTHIPWWYTMGVFVIISWATVGIRFCNCFCSFVTLYWGSGYVV